MNIIFMGNAAWGEPLLQKLFQHPDVHVQAVYTHPPKRKGRGHHLQPGVIQVCAEHHHCPVLTPSTLRSVEVQDHIRSLNPSIILVVAYGLLLPKNILDLPGLGCLNVHASLLPRWRGASPLHQAILAGDTMTGIALMHMEEGLDTGPVYAQWPLEITCEDTYDSLAKKSSMLAAHVIPAMLPLVRYMQACPQASEGVCYAPKITAEDMRISWHHPAPWIERQIRTFHPKVWALDQGQRLRIGSARVCQEQSEDPPGTVIASPLQVVCGENTVLSLQSVQKEAGRMMPVEDFLRGQKISVGSVLT